MKKIGIRCLIGLFLAIALMICSAAVAEEYGVTLNADLSSAWVGDKIVFSYDLTGSGTPDSIDFKAVYTYMNGGNEYSATFQEAELYATNGKITVTVPQYASNVYAEITVKDGSDVTTRKSAVIPINGANIKSNPIKVLLTFSPSVPVAGQDVKVSWTITGGSGSNYKAINPTWCFYDDDNDQFLDSADKDYAGNSGSFTAGIPDWSTSGTFEIVVMDEGDPEKPQMTKTVKKTFATELIIDTEPQDQTVNENTNAQFTVSASGSGLTYQWQYKTPKSTAWYDTTAVGASTATLTIPGAVQKNGYQYRCVVTDKYGETVTTRAATLTVNTQLTITTNPKDATVNEGTTATFTVAVKGDGVQYQWQYRTSETGSWTKATATGTTTDTITVPGTTSRNGYQYYCIVHDKYGKTAESSVATLTVKTPLTITTQPENAMVTEGTTVKFSVKATGDGLKYQWQYRTSSTGKWIDATAGGSRTATMSVPATQSRKGYQYHCVITDKYNDTISSAVAVLTVQNFLTIETQPVNVTVAEGENAKFTVKATGDGLKYQWQFRFSETGTWLNATASGATTATLIVPGTVTRQNYQYQCIVTDYYAKKEVTNTVTLTVQAKLRIISSPSNTEVAEGTDAKFRVKAEGDGLKYQWKCKTSATASWTDATETGAKTAVLTVPGTVSRKGYQYRCEVTDQYGHKSVTLTGTLAVKTKLRIDTEPTDQSVALGTDAKFTVKATGDGLKYQWKFRTSKTGAWSNATATGATTATVSVPGTASRSGYQYECVVTDKYGVSVTTKVVNLYVQPAIKITAQPKNSGSVAASTNVVYSVKATGDGLKYQWQFRENEKAAWTNSPSAGATTDTLTVVATEPKNGYEYQCVITDKYGKKAVSNKATMTVQVTLRILTQPSGTTAAAGETVKFSVKAVGTEMKYQWQYRTSTTASWTNATATGATEAIVSVPASLNRDGYQYRCVITDKYGKKVTSTAVTLKVHAALKITKQPAKIAAKTDAGVKFTVTAEGVELKYQWETKSAAGTSWSAVSGNGATTATLTVKATTDRDGSQYRCVITDKYGAKVTSSAAALSVPKAVRITSQPASRSVKAGNTVTFTVKAEGTGLTYTWKYCTAGTADWKNASASGSNTASISVPATMSRNGNQYKCVVKDQYGNEVESSTVTLKILQ